MQPLQATRPQLQGQAGQEEATEGPFLHPQPGWGDDPGHTLAVTDREVGRRWGGGGEGQALRSPREEASWWSWHEGRDLEEE